jgi:hypothetical protein
MSGRFRRVRHIARRDNSKTHAANLTEGHGHQAFVLLGKGKYDENGICAVHIITRNGRIG